MSTINEVSALILFMLFGFWLLHVLNGTGMKWFTSFFSASTGTASGSPFSTGTNISTTPSASGPPNTNLPYAPGRQGGPQ